MTRRWPLQALLDTARLTPDGLRKKANIRPDAYQLAEERGLSDKQADRWSIRCGLHPSMCWGPEWIEAGLSENDRHYLAGGWRQAWLWNEATELDEGKAA